MKSTYESHNKILTYLHNIDNQLKVADMIIELESKSVLDIGCFDGTLLGALIKRKWKGNYQGIDISEDMIRQAKALYPEYTFLQGNVMDIPEHLDYDIVIIGGVFYYLENNESQEVINKIASIKKAKHILYHDVFRCKNSIYKFVNLRCLVEKGTFLMSNAKHSMSAGDNSKRKYNLIYL
tara:strand:+ start:2181 stop:2720 length:540 start_codon:yes stop_codon:yes gene_type:complete